MQWFIELVGGFSILPFKIPGSTKDKQLRKHLPRIHSLMKNVSWTIENDRKPS